MDWSKLDARLADELADSGRSQARYAVFVRLVAPVEPERLTELGLDGAGDQVRTATLSRADIDRLSEQAEVRHIALSRPLGLLGRT